VPVRSRAHDLYRLRCLSQQLLSHIEDLNNPKRQAHGDLRQRLSEEERARCEGLKKLEATLGGMDRPSPKGDLRVKKSN
jgi:hypothetical protein